MVGKPRVGTMMTLVPSTLVRNTVSNDVEFVHSRPRPIAFEHVKTMRYLKLALMEPEAHHDERSDSKLLEFIQDQLRTNAASGIPGTTHASMILKGLWDMAIKRYPIENCLLNVAITYPSCWNTQELGRLQKAVNEAEIPRQATTLQYVPEQTAAAFGVVHEYQNEMVRDLQVRVSICAIYCLRAMLTCLPYRTEIRLLWLTAAGLQ